MWIYTKDLHKISFFVRFKRRFVHWVPLFSITITVPQLKHNKKRIMEGLILAQDALPFLEPRGYGAKNYVSLNSLILISLI